MAGRFDFRPLLVGVATGLRHRRPAGKESADWGTRFVLVAVPTMAGVAAGLLNVQILDPGQLLAAAALFVGAMLTAFSQVAAWRERIAERRRALDRAAGREAKFDSSASRELKLDRSADRALEEAGAHILTSVLLSVVVSAVVLAVGATANLPSMLEEHRETGARVLTGLAVGCLTYIGLVLAIVVNLMWDAFARKRRNDER